MARMARRLQGPETTASTEQVAEWLVKNLDSNRGSAEWDTLLDYIHLQLEDLEDHPEMYEWDSPKQMVEVIVAEFAQCVAVLQGRLATLDEQGVH